MENIHIRLESDEAILAKKELLNSQINSLQTLKAFKNFKVSRKRELILREKFRNALSELFSAIEDTEKSLPTEKDESSELRLLQRMSKGKFKTSKKKSDISGKKEYKELEKELLEIREKLAKLG